MTSEFGAPPAVAEHYASVVDPEDDMELPEDDEIESEDQIVARQEAIDRAARTTVDGEEAEVVFDGASGEPRLLVVETTDDEVLKHIARAREEEAAYHIAAKQAVNAFKKAKERTEQAVAFATEHYARTRQLALALEVPREGSETDE
jgi:hypothetical protein